MNLWTAHSKYFQLPSAPRPHRYSPSCEEAPFEMTGLSENTQIHLIIRGQSQCALFDIWKENSYAGQLISGSCCCLYKCLGLPQSARCVSSWDTDLFVPPQPHGDFSESLQRSLGWQSLWLRLCSSVAQKTPQVLRFVVPIAFSFSQDSGYAPGYASSLPSLPSAIIYDYQFFCYHADVTLLHSFRVQPKSNLKKEEWPVWACSPGGYIGSVSAGPWEKMETSILERGKSSNYVFKALILHMTSVI